MQTSSAEYSAPIATAWIASLRGELGGGGADAGPELAPSVVIAELENVCSTMLAGRGGPNEKDRKSICAEFWAMRGTLGPAVQNAIGPLLNDVVRDLRPGVLSTPQGARSLELTLVQLKARVFLAAVAQAAWDDVVDAFRDSKCSAELGEQRLAILRDVSDGLGHDWTRFGGVAYRLARLLSDDLSEAHRVGAVAEVADWSQPAGLTEERRIAACRTLLAEPARRDDVAVWFLFRNAYVPGWQRIGPVEFFDVAFVPDQAVQGGALSSYPGYEPPPELEDWQAAALHLGDLRLDEGERAVFARVSLKDTLVERAPERARHLVETLLELANDRSEWRLQKGEPAHSTDGGWFGPMGFMPPDLRYDVPPFQEGTAARLKEFSESFVASLAEQDSAAAEAVEDARWVVAVSRAPSQVQRVALGTRALERVLGIAQRDKEDWTDTATRYLLAAWIRLTLRRWKDDAARAVYYGVFKSHGRGSAELTAAADAFWPPFGGGRWWDAKAIASFDTTFGALDDWIDPGFAEHRLARQAILMYSDSSVAGEWLKASENRFQILLSRAQRSRNAVIHGQRPSLGTLETIDGFVSDLGRFVAQDSMYTAERGEAPLARLETWRAELVEVRAALDAGKNPATTLMSMV